MCRDRGSSSSPPRKNLKFTAGKRGFRLPESRGERVGEGRAQELGRLWQDFVSKNR